MERGEGYESREAEVTSGGPLLSLLRCRLPGKSRDTGVVTAVKAPSRVIGLRPAFLIGTFSSPHPRSRLCILYISCGMSSLLNYC